MDYLRYKYERLNIINIINELLTNHLICNFAKVMYGKNFFGWRDFFMKIGSGNKKIIKDNFYSFSTPVQLCGTELKMSGYESRE